MLAPGGEHPVFPLEPGTLGPHRRPTAACWGAILAIPTVIFSLYGMNFEWMPELKWKAGYPFAVAVTAFVCAFVYRRLRRAGCVQQAVAIAHTDAERRGAYDPRWVKESQS